MTTMSSSIDNWIKQFLPEYEKLGVKVTIVCNMTQDYAKKLEDEYNNVVAYPIDFPRGANITKSIKSILKLKKLFKENNFDMVQYSTPNASVYGSIAAKRAGIPIRLYCQWGMVYVTSRGLKRTFYKFLEKTTCRLSTIVQPDSIGNLEFCRKEKLYDDKKSEVIWNGSAKGVDLSKYDAERKTEYSAEIKNRYNIPEDAVILGFVGRLGAEKGCNELFLAFRELEKQYKNLLLMFVGPIEKRETITPELLKYFDENDKIIKTGRVSDVEKHIAAMDVFILPSHREGFGMSVVEAEAMEVPVIVTEYPGPVCGMIPNKTGLTIPIGDPEKIIEVVTTLLEDKEKRRLFGKAGREYAVNSFNKTEFTKKYMENRKKLLGI